MLDQVMEVLGKIIENLKPILTINLKDIDFSDIKFRPNFSIYKKLREIKNSKEYTSIEDYEDKTDELTRLINDFSQPNMDLDDFLTSLEDLVLWANDIIDGDRKVCEIII